MKNLDYRKISKGANHGLCWFCGKPTHNALTYPNGSQVWYCIECLDKHKISRKIKGFNMGRYKTIQKPEQKNLNEFLHTTDYPKPVKTGVNPCP